MRAERIGTDAPRQLAPLYGVHPLTEFIQGIPALSSARRACLGEAAANTHRKAVADIAIGLQLLLPIALDAGRILGRPVFHICGHGVRQLQEIGRAHV